MAAPGRIILLNGTSSAGKTTLAAALRAHYDERGESWLVVGIDDYLAKVPPAMWTGTAGFGFAPADDGAGVVFTLGPDAQALLAVYRESAASFARRGLNVIVDEVVLDDTAWSGWQSALDGLDPFWVRVDCPLDVREERERARSNRQIGIARGQDRTVHHHPPYRLAVDTSTATPAELAARIATAFAEL